MAMSPDNFDAEWSCIDVGAEVLALREDNGVLFVTTTKGTFPLDPRFLDANLNEGAE